LRKHLAKMMVNFKKNVLWDVFDDNIVDSCFKYDDLDNVSDELKWYIYMVCNMWIMWIDSVSNLPQDDFIPDGVVSRAEFATVLSRVLWWSKYDVSQWIRYTKHLWALKKEWYIKYIDWDWPISKEIRKYVWLMLQRVWKDN